MLPGEDDVGILKAVERPEPVDLLEHRLRRRVRAEAVLRDRPEGSPCRTFTEPVACDSATATTSRGWGATTGAGAGAGACGADRDGRRCGLRLDAGVALRLGGDDGRLRRRGRRGDLDRGRRGWWRRRGFRSRRRRRRRPAAEEGSARALEPARGRAQGSARVAQVAPGATWPRVRSGRPSRRTSRTSGARGHPAAGPRR